MKQEKILILYSGGLDSLIMKRFAEVKYPDAEVNFVWFDIGQEYSEKERNALPSNVDIRKIQWGAELVEKGAENTVAGNIFIPGRNAVFVILGASIYLPDKIWLGALLGETHEKSTDKNFVFKEKMNDMLNYTYSPWKEINMEFPLAEAGMGKYEAVKWALDNGLTEKDLRKTSSCLSGEEGNCGKCLVCVRRWGIYGALGFFEEYNIDPLENIEAIDYMITMVEGKRDAYRQREIVYHLENIFHTEDRNEMKQILLTKKDKILNE